MSSECPVVSFCIPVYNNAEAAQKIAEGLLISSDTRFEVIMCDDASTDDAYDRLSNIHDERFRYVRNDKNLGAHKNWLKSLELGNGEWLYLAMGRDKLHGEHIGNLIELLKYAADNNITCLKDRNRKKEIQIYKGINAMIEFVAHDHPTGIIFNRNVFLAIPNREHCFESSDMYPECCIEFQLLLKGDGAVIRSGVSLGEEPVIDKSKVKSTVERGKSLDEIFFSPSRTVKQFYERIDMLEGASNGIFNAYEINKFFGSNFKSVLKDVSVWWKRACSYTEYMAHYGYETRYVGRNEMLHNIFMAYRDIKKHLKENDMYTFTKQLIMYYYTAKIIMRVLIHAR